MFMLMLRNNSKRAVSSKQQGLMADNATSFPISPTKNHTNPPISPRIFNGFLTRSLSDVVEAGINSPKSILDGKQMLNLGNPFGYDRNCANSITNYELESEGIKLALLLDPIENEEMVLFGTELKAQSPAILVQTSASSVESLNSPTDFGIKTRDSQLLASSFTESKELEKDSSCRDGLSLREMKSSEDYTCVITHGPNPKTTHIFDNCVVGTCLS